MYNLSEVYYGLDEQDVFGVVSRVSNKRSLLFANKLIGKYVSAKASDVIYHSMLLARRLNDTFVFADDMFDWNRSKEDFVSGYLDSYYSTDKEMVFIGFAETATGLGHGVFDRFNNSVYLHTTREDVWGKTSVIDFEEEHSPGNCHRFYVSEDMFNNKKPIILVDDEVTTGRTKLNIIKEIQRKFPRDEYVIVSYINWMGEAEYGEYREFEKSSGVKIKFVYLISGTFDRDYDYNLNKGNVTDEIDSSTLGHVEVLCDMFKSEGDYIVETGRFGITHDEHLKMKRNLYESTFKRDGSIVVIGDGELSYIPTLIAYFLGDHYVKSTVRNNLFVGSDEGYVVKDGIRFGSLDGKDVKMHLYNMRDEFDEALVVIEKKYVRDRLDVFVSGLFEKGNFKKVNILKLAWGIE